MPEEKWRIELEKKLHNHDCCMRPDELKDFIRQEIIKSRQSLIKELIEKMPAHDIGCEIQHTGKCSCPIREVLDILNQELK